MSLFHSCSFFPQCLPLGLAARIIVLRRDLETCQGTRVLGEAELQLRYSYIKGKVAAVGGLPLGSRAQRYLKPPTQKNQKT